ncbi:MAG TPA: DUF1269 domain-containing protein [Caulobacteraceae bacterium]|nr:DUF1269 domain-containing protein [Caulobacteraceae bacterium]
MTEFAVVVFPDRAKAYEGLKALTDLHNEGSATVYATAVVHRDADGALKVDERSYEGPVGTALATLVGALIGVFGGPAGVVAGAATGTLIGGTRDLLDVDVSDDFLGETETELTPGKYAVVAEIAEDWTAPLDVRMGRIGGTVVRESRDAFADTLMEQRADAMRQSFKHFEAERASARAEDMEDRLDAQLAREQKRLNAMADKARTKIEERKAELNSKLEALQVQAGKATPAVRSRIEQRIAALRQDFEGRGEQLRRAYELSTEAIKAQAQV